MLAKGAEDKTFTDRIQRERYNREKVRPLIMGLLLELIANASLREGKDARFFERSSC